MEPVQRGCGPSKPAAAVRPVGRPVSPVAGAGAGIARPPIVEQTLLSPGARAEAGVGTGLSAAAVGDGIDPSDNPALSAQPVPPRTADVPLEVVDAWKKKVCIGDGGPKVVVKQILRLFLHQCNVVAAVMLPDEHTQDQVDRLVALGLIQRTPMSPGHYRYTENLFDKKTVDDVVAAITCVFKKMSDGFCERVMLCALGVRLGEGSSRSVLQPLFLRFLLMLPDRVLPAATLARLNTAFAFDDAVTAYVIAPATAPPPSSCLPADHAWGFMHVPAFFEHSMYALVRASVYDSSLVDIVLVNAGCGLEGDMATGIEGHTRAPHDESCVHPVYGRFTANGFDEYVRRIRVVQPKGDAGKAAAVVAVYTGFRRFYRLERIYSGPVYPYVTREQVTGNCVLYNMWEALQCGLPEVHHLGRDIVNELLGLYRNVLKEHLQFPYVQKLVDYVLANGSFSPDPHFSYLP
jgi:hypothetical protein